MPTPAPLQRASGPTRAAPSAGPRDRPLPNDNKMLSAEDTSGKSFPDEQAAGESTVPKKQRTQGENSVRQDSGYLQTPVDVNKWLVAWSEEEAAPARKDAEEEASRKAAEEEASRKAAEEALRRWKEVAALVRLIFQPILQHHMFKNSPIGREGELPSKRVCQTRQMQAACP